MIACSSISTCVKNVSHLSGCGQRQMTSWISGVTPRAPSGTCCFCFLSDHLKLKYSEISVLKTNKCLSVVGFQAVNISYFRPSIAKQRSNLYTSTVRSIISSRFCLKTCLGIPLGSEHTTLRHIVPKQGMIPKIICNARSSSWLQGCVPGLIFGFLVSYSTSERVHAEALQAKKNKDQDCDSSSVGHSHGKNVYTDYSIIGIPGDGRCMFRSVAHGACVRSGKPAPDERMQRELADELRASVANEFIRRRKETEWDRSFIASARKASQGLVLYYVWQTRELRTFRAQYKNELKMKLLPKEIETFAAKGTVIANRFIEGDFDTYVSQIRKPHVWGGEPELLMASHVLQMPITVYMYDKDSGGLISIAEYGQEYGKDDPVKVLYHGFGHYDALQIHENKGGRSRL